MELKEAEQLAIDLINQFGLDFKFKWIRSNNYCGKCSYKKKEIQLSKSITELNNEEIVKDTILHEIAHALIGPNHGHNFVWKEKAIEIGCSGTRTASSFTIIPYIYDLVCPKCGTKWGYNKRSHRNYFCKCGEVVSYNNFIKR